MYLKLALRNIKRSAKDYVIYFVTITLIVMLMYSFLALGFSDDIISLSENMSMLTTGMITLSIIVALISSYIISYAVQFMLRQRKKEFAIYELLGMEVSTIQKLYLIENIVIGVFAFGIGLVLGTGIVGVLTGVVKNIFRTPQFQEGAEVPEQITMGVTVQAWGVSNSLTGFTAISFCSLYLSIAFILLSCTILAFEQLSALDHNRRNYQCIDRIGVSKMMQRKLIHRELSTFFFIPLVLPAIILLLLMSGAQSLFGSYIMQENIIVLYGFITTAIFAVIYYLYYATTYFLYRRNIIR